MTLSHPLKIGGLILAGGEGQRVNRQNKGLLRLHNKPLVQHVIDKLQPQVDYLAISANHELEDYQQLSLPVFTDDNAWYGIGPLAGIISACSHFPSDLDAIQIAPCDTPFLPNNLVQRLSDVLFTDTANDIAYVTTEQGDHPSIFLFKPAINQRLAEHIASGKYSLKSWLFKHNAIKVLFTNEDAFTNINHLETLHTLNQTNML